MIRECAAFGPAFVHLSSPRARVSTRLRGCRSSKGRREARYPQPSEGGEGTAARSKADEDIEIALDAIVWERENMSNKDLELGTPIL